MEKSFCKDMSIPLARKEKWWKVVTDCNIVFSLAMTDKIDFLLHLGLVKEKREEEMRKVGICRTPI
jgi:hypothetical protein